VKMEKALEEGNKNEPLLGEREAIDYFFYG
jgi:hypothetical protein